LGVPGVEVAAALRPETHSRLSPDLLRAVQSALGLSLRDVFVEMAVGAALVILCSLALQGGRAESHDDAGTAHHAPPVPDDETAGLALGAGH
jgi:hypothetical protein